MRDYKDREETKKPKDRREEQKKIENIRGETRKKRREVRRKRG